MTYAMMGFYPYHTLLAGCNSILSKIFTNIALKHNFEGCFSLNLFGSVKTNLGAFSLYRGAFGLV